MKLTIATGNSRKDRVWKNKELSWEEFLERVGTTFRTSETMAEYRKLSKSKQDEIKDIGGFVGGKLKDGKRKNGFVEFRSMLTLDMDYAMQGLWEHITLLFDFACCIYSTHKHTSEKPRLRLIIPLSRTVTADEYAAVARKVAADIGIEQFDDTTYEPTRLMYWASTSSDGEFIFEKQDGEWLNPDEVLASYSDWRDSSQWAVSSRQKSIVKQAIGKQADPLSKDGVVGCFCRVYSISAVMDTFLSGIYKPSIIPERYDYIPADSSAGVVVYEDKFAYSHHATDPICGRLCNAFDLVRLHKFSDKDAEALDGTPQAKLPSFLAMQEFAAELPEVKKQLLAERQAKAAEDFESEEDWKERLTINKKGEVINLLTNLVLILENDPNLKGIVFNQMSDGMEKKTPVPWESTQKWWRDADDAQLVYYIEKNYGSFSSRNFNVAVSKVSDDRSYHPVREFLDSLPEWDKVHRLDRLFVEYFSADDIPYTRAITRKIFTAAVARIYKPGIKFDWMLVLNGDTGIGKSTLIQKLGGEWFNDSLKLSDTQDKTAAEKLQGYWILEIGELAGMKKADENVLKNFLSSQNDVYRASFGKRATPHPRQCVFIGSTNEKRGYLRDTTGNRRFWTLKVYPADKKPWNMSEEERLQIWAEAKQRYLEDEPLQLPEELEKYAAMLQNEAMEVDDRQGIIEDYLEMLLPEDWDTYDIYKRREYVSEYHNKDSIVVKGKKKRMTVMVMEIWCEAFGKNKADLERIKSYEITKMLRRIEGWVCDGSQARDKVYGKQLIFKRVETEKS